MKQFAKTWLKTNGYSLSAQELPAADTTVIWFRNDAVSQLHAESITANAGIEDLDGFMEAAAAKFDELFPELEWLPDEGAIGYGKALGTERSKEDVLAGFDEIWDYAFSRAVNK